jgi:branched-chain amino acid transport system permease protein
MQTAVHVLVNGLESGSLYALLALGLTLIYRITGVVNFAHGEFATLATFVSFTLTLSFGWPVWLAVFPTVLVAAIGGAAIQRFAVRPLASGELAAVIGTLGLFLLINSLTGLVWGYQPRAYPNIFPTGTIDLGGILISVQDFSILGVSVVLMLGLGAVLTRTKLGLAMRATADDAQVARWMGINTHRIDMLAWSAASVVGLAAGVMFASTHTIDPNMLVDILLKGFAAAVVGGLVSLSGAVVGGLAIGVAENVVASYIATDLKTTLSFVLIIVVLAFRPQGLLGTVARARV